MVNIHLHVTVATPHGETAVMSGPGSCLQGKGVGGGQRRACKSHELKSQKDRSCVLTVPFMGGGVVS